MKLFLSSILILASVTLGFSQTSAHSQSKINKIVVNKVLQTTSYTYLYVAENEELIWIAVPSIDAKVNDVYYYQGGMEMREFKSTELDTIFQSIWFVQGIYDENTIKPASSQQNASTAQKEQPKNNEVIKPLAGGVTIAELINNREKYANKKVVLKGRVTKFSSKIMGTNWIHISDGSSTESDITITSDEIVKIGDVITIKGTIILDKDFGYGYFYKVLMENGEIVD